MERGICMVNATVKRIAKHSIVYSYVLSQPFAMYVDAYPVLESLKAKDLAYGNHGESVKVLQQKLSDLSYYKDSIDGKYGVLTEYALKKFQKDYHTDVTGQANKETIQAFIEIEKESHLKRLNNLSETVYPGMHGEDVKIVQDSLAFLGYYEGSVDGIYGPMTEQALELAQEKHDISLMDQVTQESLRALYEETEENEQHEDDDSSSSSSESKKEKNNEKRKEEINEQDEQDVEQEIKVMEKEASPNTSDMIQTARSFIGTPYEWGGESPGGFDCSGFIQFVYNTEDITIPRTVRETWNFGQPVDSPSVGDLVFFETYQPGPSHMGIYLGNNQFIHAGESRGVEISDLDNSYWEPRYIGAKRITQ